MFYLQVQADGMITDCIEYAHKDYVPYEGTIPRDILVPCYKLIDGVIVEIPELRPKSKDEQIDALKVEIAGLQDAVLTLMDISMMGGM